MPMHYGDTTVALQPEIDRLRLRELAVLLANTQDPRVMGRMPNNPPMSPAQWQSLAAAIKPPSPWGAGRNLQSMDDAALQRMDPRILAPFMGDPAASRHAVEGMARNQRIQKERQKMMSDAAVQGIDLFGLDPRRPLINTSWERPVI